MRKDDFIGSGYGNLLPIPYPHYDIQQLPDNKWIAIVSVNPFANWIVGTEYSTELEAEFYAKRKLQEIQGKSE